MTGHRPQPIHLVVPGPLDTPTGGFVYDRKISESLRRAGRLGTVLCLHGGFPDACGASLATARRQLAGLPAAGPVVVDGLALTALNEAGDALPPPHRLVALVHHALVDENGPLTADAERLFDAERRALAETAGVIVTSAATARRLQDFGQAPARTRVVEPGLARPTTQRPRKTRPDGPLQLLCVGSLVPRKAQDVLLAALADLRDLDWRLALVGAARDAGFAASLRDLAGLCGIADRVAFHGVCDADALAAHYAAADVFVLASRHEGFGMALAEAMAHGLPILSCRTGAIPNTVPDEAGQLVPPGDSAALGAALRLMLTDRTYRSRCGRAARKAARRFPSWQETGSRFLAAVDALTAAA